MALRWNIENCNDWQELITDKEWPLTNALIWTTMGVDLGDITVTNVTKFYARIKVWELACGALLRATSMEKPEYEDYFITFEDVFKRVGLTCNVVDVPLTHWLKRIKRIVGEDNKQITDTKIKSTYYAALAEAETKLEELVGA